MGERQGGHQRLRAHPRTGPDDKGCDSAGVDAGGDRPAPPHAQDGTDPWRGGQTEEATATEEERQRGGGGDGRRLGVYDQNRDYNTWLTISIQGFSQRASTLSQPRLHPVPRRVSLRPPAL